MRRTSLPGLGAAAALILCAGTALGDPVTFPECTRKPTPQDIEGAKGAHTAGAQWFEKGDYDRAIQYYRDAYAFDCTAHRILINIANAYERKGDKQAAVETLEIYLIRAPKADDASTISERVINLKNSMKPAPPPAGTTTAPPPPPVATGTAEPLPPPPPPDTGGGGAPSYVPWVVVGVGGVATIAGVILLPVGLGKIASAEEKCGERRQCNDQAAIDEGNSGRTLSTVGTVALVGGLVLVGGGLVWQFVFNKPTTTASSQPGAPPTGFVRLAPAGGPGGGGLSITGAF